MSMAGRLSRMHSDVTIGEPTVLLVVLQASPVLRLLPGALWSWRTRGPVR